MIATVPSLVPVYPGAEFQEREAWDLLGIRFEGHPDLRPNLDCGKDLKVILSVKIGRKHITKKKRSRSKAAGQKGRAYRVEENNPFAKNVHYPAGFDPETWMPEGDNALYAMLNRIKADYEAKVSDGLHTDLVIVNLARSIPPRMAFSGWFYCWTARQIVALKPVMGYLHRNHEKIGERNAFLMNMPFTDRLDYLSSMSNNFGYALAVEKLMGIKPPERAEYLRVIMAEMTRITNHLFAIGSLLNDLGAFFTPMLYAMEERELILDVFEAVSGARMMCNYFRFGGVARDLPEGVYRTHPRSGL